ncbi:MAG: hypothetical protein J5I91_01195 [Bacteroidetes bacterium]|nr:hypothetical protein [Bacteroidota bacterium]
MSAEKIAKSKGVYWVLFLVSLSVLALLLMFLPEIFWMALPPTVTSFALGMDWI